MSFKGKSEGKVLKVLERTKKEFTGIVDRNKNVFFLIPDDKSVKKPTSSSIKAPKWSKKGPKSENEIFVLA